MKIVAISDTHNKHRELKIPPCDLLIHAGDATMFGTEAEMNDFFDWFDGQSAEYKIFVPGNHEVGYYHSFNWGSWRKHLLYYELLIDDSTTINNPASTYEDPKSPYRIYGSPWTHVSPKWAWQFPWYEKNDETRKKIWSNIPEDVEILITHGPPYGILDEVPKHIHLPTLDKSMDITQNIGDSILLSEIKKRKKLKYHFFGHVHEGYGDKEIDGVHYYNVAVCDRTYKPANPITILEI